MKIASRNNNRRKPQVRTSQLVLGILVCVLAGAVVLFGTSMAFLTQHEKQTSGNNNNNIKEDVISKPLATNTNTGKKEKSASTLLRHQLPAPPAISSQTVKTALDKVKQEFYDRYGGEQAANALYQKTITFFGAMDKTADRILRAVAQQEAFVMGFAGYSITVGRGNFFSQSFPFVVERTLQDILQKVGVPNFIVRNSAIGGIPSFPYAYCLDHFVSKQTDVLSWDFSMNEMSKDPAVFEAYLRQALHQLPKQPMIIMVDNNNLRAQVLEKYVNLGLLQGALTVAKAGAVIDPALLQKPDDQKPPGLQKWDEFGAPDGCPGKGSWHPKKAEHEFMGWMIAMHFVQALEIVHQTQVDNPNHWYKPYLEQQPQVRVTFPKPLSNPPPNDESVTEILFGHANDNDNQYQMKELSCRTNFLPATDYEKVLPSLVIAGLSNEATAENIMETRNDDFYHKGWVLDVSPVERDTKRKVETCGGLGYIDMKIALYGIPESGPLELFLPYEGAPHDHNDATESDAQHWFDGLIVCEANDKRSKEACQLDRDIEYVVGGVKVPSVVRVNGAGEYLKRKTCVSVGVPAGAKIGRRQEVAADSSQTQGIGLPVSITAKAPVTRKVGACCLSHIVWEQH
ncbi:expressed unknown protein [Seminavis robusta]|uniref:Uncharacterized protein n=1 Tax=Seminavis robusta TaxID=568900 RepID=A0A9N8HE64_9STRA|nr:expressed unknown protein [Seminavis robusta]|eukprot:Sro289_g109090.1 n/a (626) ;mRNA; r:32770-34647